MKKIVISTYGAGLNLSTTAIKEYFKRKFGKNPIFVRKALLNPPLFGWHSDKDEQKYQVKIISEKQYADETNDAFVIPYSGFMFICTESPSESDMELGKVPENIVFCPEEDIDRDDEILISIVEELQEKARKDNIILKILEIPNDVEWKIILQNVEGKNFINCEKVVQFFN